MASSFFPFGDLGVSQTVVCTRARPTLHTYATTPSLAPGVPPPLVRGAFLWVVKEEKDEEEGR